MSKKFKYKLIELFIKNRIINPPLAKIVNLFMGENIGPERIGWIQTDNTNIIIIKFLKLKYDLVLTFLLKKNIIPNMVSENICVIKNFNIKTKKMLIFSINEKDEMKK